MGIPTLVMPLLAPLVRSPVDKRSIDSSKLLIAFARDSDVTHASKSVSTDNDASLFVVKNIALTNRENKIKLP